MKEYIIERVVEIADYLVERKCTVREVANIFCVSKSTAHKDLAERLPLIDGERYRLVANVLERNWEERCARGGEATRNKYKNE